MANMSLRDRDGVLTKEGLIFRVFGYSHPANAYICDAEYASAGVSTSKDPRAPRTGGTGGVFYKFYDDEGWKFVSSKFPQYMVLHEMLGQRVVGVHQADIAESRKPEVILRALAEAPPKDELIDAAQRVLQTVRGRSGLATSDFGVFGSMLHGFYHPKFSDIDLIVYGIDANRRVRATLEELYGKQSGFMNEFDSPTAMEGKRWRFKNFTVQEFVWHQRRKQIYGLFNDAKSGRVIKAEFEPVKAWSEIKNEYEPATRIVRKDWVKIRARVTEDAEAPFVPSVYGIEPLEVLAGPEIGLEAVRVVSYMEEFRVQAWKDEIVIVEGNLDEVVSPQGSFHQVTLTYCPRYYEQTLKVAELPV